MALQIIYTNSQQAQENVLNIISHQRTANQNHNGIPFHTHLHSYKQKNKNNGCEDAEKSEHSYTADGNIKCCSHFEKQRGHFLKVLNIELPVDLTIPLLGTDPGEVKTQLHENLYTNVHSDCLHNSKNMGTTRISFKPCCSARKGESY